MNKLSYIIAFLLLATSCGHQNFTQVDERTVPNAFVASEDSSSRPYSENIKSLYPYSPLSAASKCQKPYDETGLLYRRYTNYLDSAIGNANYISADIFIPKIDKIMQN